jgi:UDP-N-acetyl-D-glucosamine dehydrogenase
VLNIPGLGPSALGPRQRNRRLVTQRPPDQAEKLASLIESREALIGVLGIGYVGLPLSLAFVAAGFRVLGFDVNEAKVAQLNAGEPYLKHLDPAPLKSARERERLLAITDFTRLEECDAILICVPTPLTAQREPDMTFIVQSAEAIQRSLRPGQLVVLESTSYPGTTDELVKGILEQTPLRSGQDFFLGFSPEREDPGNAEYSTTTIPKVVGGVDEPSAHLTQALYATAIQRTIAVSSARTAEAVKLTENIFRAVNIALVNELKVVYDRMGIDVWEVLDAASTKPFGFMRFNPGPGLGGHCVPLDPFYLTWKAREYGLSTRFVELSGEVNEAMPRYVLEKTHAALNTHKKALNGSRVLVLGVAYKRDIDDARESPAFDVIALLEEYGAEVDYHDPHIPELQHEARKGGHTSMYSRPLSAELLEASDAVVIVTDHRAVDYKKVLKHAPLIVDTRGVFRGNIAKVVRA